MSSRNSILKLYKTMLRESEKFSSYNFRNYAIRRTRDGFRENKHLTDPEEVSKQIEYARKNLEIIKRQVAVGSMYGGQKLIIENDTR
ncbi:LYR motif-containing protein 4 [Ischnura elegans]|uniref:LYR motif-containing protein 4 n=1 Tax=Ischnura elegans TaxID=197161 RepID=UPI001ED88D1E|nr:LYR motif-containing protein 4 [Ischnura elegans]